MINTGKFADFYNDVTKMGTKIPQDRYLRTGLYPIIDQGRQAIAGRWDDENGVFRDVPAIVFGDHTRAIKYVEEPFFIGADGVKIFRPQNAQDNPKYLFYALQAVKIPDLGYSRHFKVLKELNIRVCHRDEQDKIVAKLDKISDLIEKRRQQLETLDNLVKSRFIEIFGDPTLNPKEWPTCELSEYINFLTSGSRGWSQYFADSGEYFITIKNVKNCRITLEDVQYVIPPDNAEAKRTRVQEGDLLISITADLGRTGVVTKEIADYGGYINQHLTCIRINQDAVRPLYVAHYMESEAGKSQFRSKNQSAVKAGLNFNAINSLRLMVPPIELQDEFISFVEQVDKQKLTIQASLDKLELLKKSLMQEYFG